MAWKLVLYRCIAVLLMSLYLSIECCSFFFFELVGWLISNVLEVNDVWVVDVNGLELCYVALLFILVVVFSPSWCGFNLAAVTLCWLKSIFLLFVLLFLLFFLVAVQILWKQNSQQKFTFWNKKPKWNLNKCTCQMFFCVLPEHVRGLGYFKAYLLASKV